MNLVQNSRRICTPRVPVKSKPDPHCEASNELLFGETVQVLEQGLQWCKIKSEHDAYEGYIENQALGTIKDEATHWVINRSTFIFEKADIKAPLQQRLLFGSQLSACTDTENLNFLRLCTGGFVWAEHCKKMNAYLTSSMIEIAQKIYLQAPYLWGGRGSDGCDCSGLMQMLAMAKGISLPRDSADQESALKSDVSFDSRAAENFVFWPGHVGILTSPDLLLHATAHSLQCCIEPLQAVIERAGEPSSIKRVC